jgi:hypothetical protein
LKPCCVRIGDWASVPCQLACPFIRAHAARRHAKQAAGVDASAHSCIAAEGATGVQSFIIMERSAATPTAAISLFLVGRVAPPKL